MQSQGIVSIVYNIKLLIVLNLFAYLNGVVAWNAEVNTKESTSKERNNMTISSYQMSNISSNHELNETLSDGNGSIPLHRTKRQSGGGKYADAAKMPQVKILRLWLQLFANSWSKVYVGGAHPFHHNVPKPVVFLFKQRIGDFLFPKLDADNTQ